MSGDICDWLAQEEANAEQWSDYDMDGARFYREQFAAARNEIERLREVHGVREKAMSGLVAEVESQTFWAELLAGNNCWCGEWEARRG